MTEENNDAEKINDENPVKVEEEPEPESSSSDERFTALENRTTVNEQKLEEMSGQLSGILGSVENLLKPESDSTPASLPWTHRGRR